MTASTTFRAAPDVAVRDWGGTLAVAYSYRSNSTHLLTAEAAKLLRVASGGVLHVLDGDPAEAIVTALAGSGLLVEIP